MPVLSVENGGISSNGRQKMVAKLAATSKLFGIQSLNIQHAKPSKRCGYSSRRPHRVPFQQRKGNLHFTNGD